MSLDPAALQVLISRLTGVAEEMGAVLRRAAFSPNIKERADCSAALFTADGELLVQAEHIPVHLGSMPASVAAAIDAFGDDARPGRPGRAQRPVRRRHPPERHHPRRAVLRRRRGSIGWVANRAHHADVGGAAPGSIPADATEIHQEGLRLPPVRLTDEVRRPVLRELADAGRAGGRPRRPGRRQRASASSGWPSSAGAPLDEVVDYGERRMRAALAALPDGEWTLRRRHRLDRLRRPTSRRRRTIACAVTIAGDEITFDFTGTDRAERGQRQRRRGGHGQSAVAFALRGRRRPDDPGQRRCAAPGPGRRAGGHDRGGRPPAAVGRRQRRGEPAGRRRLPRRAGPGPARPGRRRVAGDDEQRAHRRRRLGVLRDRRRRSGRPPRRPAAAGMSGVHTGMTNTKNTPIEALERAFPMRVRRYRLRRGSGGAGRLAGRRRHRARPRDARGRDRVAHHRAPGVAALGAGRRRRRARSARTGSLPGGDERLAERLPDKCTIRLEAGDVLRMLTPGGGGWGDPELTGR